MIFCFAIVSRFHFIIGVLFFVQSLSLFAHWHYQWFSKQLKEKAHAKHEPFLQKLITFNLPPIKNVKWLTPMVFYGKVTLIALLLPAIVTVTTSVPVTDFRAC